MIIFKHKELGTTISLEQIKECYNKNGEFGKVILRSSLSATSGERFDDICLKQRVYKAKDIPFSEDFTLERHDMLSGLNVSEIKEILSQVQWSELKKKLVNELERRIVEGEE